MELYKIAIRAVVGYVFLLIVVRLSGKRTVSEGNAFDFVLALILGDVIDDALWAEVPMSQFFVASGTLVLLDIAANLIAAKSLLFERIISGSPEALVVDGRVVRTRRRSNQVSKKELASDLRLHGIEEAGLHTVKVAVMELRGEVSMIRTRSEQEATKRDWADA